MGRLTRVLSLSAPAEHEHALRKFTASLTRLTVEFPGAVDVLPSAEAFDDRNGSVPAYQVRAVVSGFQAGSCWFALPFRLMPYLEQLFLEALAQDVILTYQLQVAPLPEGDSLYRNARHNWAEIEALASARAHLKQQQGQVVASLARAPFLVEEFAMIENRAGIPWLEKALGRFVDSLATPLGFPPVQISVLDGAYSDVLAAGLHSSFWQPLPDDELAAMAASGVEALNALAWNPSTALSRLLQTAPLPDADQGPALSGRDAPKPYAGREPYLFISYRHSDAAEVLPYLRQLESSGLRFWYDQGIPGAAEWIEVLEERVASAEMLLVFLSQGAVDSKYVRREIQLADTLNIPILTLLMGRPELRRGLKLVLEQYQMVSLEQQPLIEIVKGSLWSLYPSKRV